jgi:outer membrane protein
MNKTLAGCFILFFTFCFCQSAFAEEMNKIGVGLSIAYLDYEQGTIADVEFKNSKTPVYSLNLTYHFTPKWSVEMGAETRKSEVTVMADGYSGVFGEIKQDSFYATGRFRFRITRTDSFIHLGAGVAYYLNEFESEYREEPDDFFPLNIIAESENSFGIHLNVGAEIYITDHWAINLDLKSVFTNAEFNFTYPDSTTEREDVALNGASYSVGFKYYF